MKPIRFAGGVKAEARAAAARYSEVQGQLAVDFLIALDEALEALSREPEAQTLVRWLPDDLPARQVSMRRFPYRVVFLERSHEFLILACAHARQQPGYWVDRLGSADQH